MREVTERDFRMPEYADEKPEDWEFRSDGKLVRKDRWERGIISITAAVGLNTREFEIPDVVFRVRTLVKYAEEGHKRRFIDRLLAVYSAGKENVYQTCLNAGYENHEVDGEKISDLEFIRTCLDTEFDEAREGESVFQDYWGDTK